MIFKVLFQPSKDAALLRERTNSIYVEAETEREVRSKLTDYPYNIEFIQPLNEAHLAYEQKSEHFQVESI